MTRRSKPTPRLLPKEIEDMVQANAKSAKRREYAKTTIANAVDGLLFVGVQPDTMAEVLEGVAQRVRSDARRNRKVKP